MTITRIGFRTIVDFPERASHNRCFLMKSKCIWTRFFHTQRSPTWILKIYLSLSKYILKWFSKWCPPISHIKKFCFVNWWFYSDFGTYFSDFGSTFHSDRGIFSQNVLSKVYFLMPFGNMLMLSRNILYDHDANVPGIGISCKVINSEVLWWKLPSSPPTSQSVVSWFSKAHAAK